MKKISLDKKLCPSCNTVKSINEFYCREKSKDGHRVVCKKCLTTYVTNRWKALKLKAVKLFGGECKICGYSKNLAAFDFHHVDPNEKEGNWNKISKKEWSAIVEELKKCWLLCRNCHAEIHHPNLSLDGMKISPHIGLLDSDRFKSFASSGKCPVCDDDVYGTKYCSTKCSHFASRKIKRPDTKELSDMIKEMPWTKIGEKYGVSDNAVRKWAKGYGIL